MLWYVTYLVDTCWSLFQKCKNLFLQYYYKLSKLNFYLQLCKNGEFIFPEFLTWSIFCSSFLLSKSPFNGKGSFTSLSMEGRAGGGRAEKKGRGQQNQKKSRFSFKRLHQNIRDVLGVTSTKLLTIHIVL